MADTLFGSAATVVGIDIARSETTVDRLPSPDDGVGGRGARNVVSAAGLRTPRRFCIVACGGAI